jgi:hypothetical protein
MIGTNGVKYKQKSETINASLFIKLSLKLSHSTFQEVLCKALQYTDCL